MRSALRRELVLGLGPAARFGAWRAIPPVRIRTSRPRSTYPDASMTRPRARLIAFFALVTFGALQWIRLLDPRPSGATLWFLLAAVVAGLGLRSCNRSRAARALGGDRRASRSCSSSSGCSLAGIPFSLVEPRGWGELVLRSEPGHRDAALDAHPVPRRGALGARHARLIGYLLVALATVLACRRAATRGPASRSRPRSSSACSSGCRRSRWRAARRCSSASSSRRCSSPTCASTASGATRWCGRARPSRGVLLAALVLAPRVDADRPIIDYEAIARSVSKTDGASFNWSHGYGPLNWPRTGRELLRIKTDRAAYWKATNLVEFDGVRWTTGGDRWLPASTPPRCPTSATRWRQRILVTVRGLRTTQVIGAGTTLVGRATRRGPCASPARGASRRGRPAHLRPGLHGRGLRAGTEPPCPGRRADDLPALQPGVPEHGAADARSAARSRSTGPRASRARASPRGSGSRPGGRARDPRWTSRRSGRDDGRRHRGPGGLALRAHVGAEPALKAAVDDAGRVRPPRPGVPLGRLRLHGDAAGLRHPARHVPVRGEGRLLPAVLRARWRSCCAWAASPRGSPPASRPAPATRSAARWSSATSTRTRGSRRTSRTIGWVTFDPTPADSPARGRDAEEEAAADAARTPRDAPTPAVSEGRAFPGGPIAAGDDATIVDGAEGQAGARRCCWCSPCILRRRRGHGARGSRSRRVRRVREAVAGDPTTLAIEELHRALRRSGRRSRRRRRCTASPRGSPGPGRRATCASWPRRATARTPRSPTARQRAAAPPCARRGGGPLGRLRSLWALPPSPPSLRRLRERRRDAS